VDNSRSRYKELRGRLYPEANSGRKAARNAASSALDNARFDAYASFLIKELKPKIDREYRTLTNAADTGLLGSSMGGICSLALAWEHPNVFGLAASLSGAFQVEKEFFLEKVLGNYSGVAKPIRVYLDSGTSDYTGGDDGLKQTEGVARELERIGWKHGADLMHFVDKPLAAEELAPLHLAENKFKEAQRSQHNELYWRLRAWRALTFFFPAEAK